MPNRLIVTEGQRAECGFVSTVLDHYAAIASTLGCSCGTRYSNYQHCQSTATILPQFDPMKERSVFTVRAGICCPRSIIVTRHLRRMLAALPVPQVNKPEKGSSSAPVVNAKVQKSNVGAGSVFLGTSRVDVISALFNADWTIRFPPQ